MEQEGVWREQIRETLFVPEDLPKLDVQVHGQFSPESGVVAERVSYGTQFGMRIPAIVYRPEAASQKQCPALIVVNGHGGDKYSWYSFYTGVLYARAGMVVLTYDPTGEGERNRDRKSGTRAHDKVEGPDELARRVSGLMMTDVMQAVSYLSQRSEVDSTRIAAAGYSMGSFVLGICGAIETRLHACVLVGGGNLDGEDEYWDNSKPMCQGIPYQSLGFLGDRGAALYAMHASRGPTLVFNGVQDTVVNMPDTGEPFFADLRVRTVALKGDEVDIFETGFVPDVSHRPFFVTRPVALWLERHMGFPFCSEADIRAMEETHIGTWAAAGGVEMDPGYATEEREAGTLALGEGVPGFERSDLNVYSDAEWEGLKDRLTHESWRRQAKAVQIST